MTLPCARVQRSGGVGRGGGFFGGGAKQRGERLNAWTASTLRPRGQHGDSGLYIKCAGIAKPGIAL